MSRAAAQSRADRVIMCSVASPPQPSPLSGPSGIRPREGFRPSTPQQDAECGSSRRRRCRARCAPCRWPARRLRPRWNRRRYDRASRDSAGRAVDRRFGSGAEPQLGAGAAAKGNQAGAAVADDDFSVHVPLYLAVQHRAHGAGQAQRGRAQVLEQGRHAQERTLGQQGAPPVPRQARQFLVRPGGQAQAQVFPQSADRVDVGITRGDLLQGLAWPGWP